MEKEEVENYIIKLKMLEKELETMDDDDIDESPNFTNQLQDLISVLGNDIKTSYGSQIDTAIPVKIKKLHQNSVIPTYSKNGDAGLDLTITSIIDETTNLVTYGFGIAIEIPSGYVGLVFPRSSIRKYELALTNSVGIIDSGYRGEIQATFKKNNWLKGNESFKYNVGERGAQIIILPYPQIKFIETDELSETERGEGGYGHTGV